MTVEELVLELQKHDKNKTVYIEQCEEYAYMVAHSVKSMELWNPDAQQDDDDIQAVVIQFS